MKRRVSKAVFKTASLPYPDSQWYKLIIMIMILSCRFGLRRKCAVLHLNRITRPSSSTVKLLSGSPLFTLRLIFLGIMMLVMCSMQQKSKYMRYNMSACVEVKLYTERKRELNKEGSREEKVFLSGHVVMGMLVITE